MNFKLCDYGCGQEAKYQMTSGKWCCESFYSKCPSVKKKNSEKTVKRLTGLFGDKNPHYGKKHSEETKKKMSFLMKNKKNPMKNSEYVMKNRLSNIGKKISSETRIKMSDAKKGNKNHFYHKTHTQISKDKIRKKVKELYKDNNFLKKYSRSLTKKPNKLESLIMTLLDKFLPKHYEFVGDYSFWIDGKNPDFINKQKNHLIELFGDYWHSEKITGKSKQTEENERIQHFKKNGYKTLIIWEGELSDIEQVIHKILNFERVENEK